MRSPIPLIILIILLAMIPACGGTPTVPPPDETGIEATNTPPPSTTSVPPTTTSESSGESGIDTLIIGTWKSVCMDVGSDVYIITTIAFDGAGQENDTVDFYSDPACASATGLVKTNQTNYSLGGNIIASGKSAFEIDTTIISWDLKQDGVLVSSGTNAPAQYDIITIEGDILFNSGLTRADPGPITSPDDRPTTLDLANFFTRQ
jgi:hypothetical protein